MTCFSKPIVLATMNWNLQLECKDNYDLISSWELLTGSFNTTILGFDYFNSDTEST